MGDLVSSDSKGLGIVINNLIDKVSSAIGWVFTRDTPKRIAVKNYIFELEKSNLPPLEKAVLISRARKDIKEYSNQLKIVNNAMAYLQATARPEKLENDWVAYFFDKAKLISECEIQEIWSRLLAEECNRPGSIPKRLLFILEKMNREEAEGFMKICAVTVSAFNESAPLLLQVNNLSLVKYGLSFDSLIQLESIGLIKISEGLLSGFSLIRDKSDKDKQSVRYFDNRMDLPERMDSFPVGRVLFTKDGTALWKVIAATEVEGFWDKTVVPLINKVVEEFQKEAK